MGKFKSKECFHILNGYRDIDIIIGSHLRKMEELVDTK